MAPGNQRGRSGAQALQEGASVDCHLICLLQAMRSAAAKGRARQIVALLFAIPVKPV